MYVYINGHRTLTNVPPLSACVGIWARAPSKMFGFCWKIEAQIGLVLATPFTTNRFAKFLPNADFDIFCFVFGVGGGGTEPLSDCVGLFCSKSR